MHPRGRRAELARRKGCRVGFERRQGTKKNWTLTSISNSSGRWLEDMLLPDMGAQCRAHLPCYEIHRTASLSLQGLVAFHTAYGALTSRRLDLAVGGKTPETTQKGFLHGRRAPSPRQGSMTLWRWRRAEGRWQLAAPDG